jgi:hypothetical protein
VLSEWVRWLIRISLMFLRPILRLITAGDLDEPPVVAGAHPKRGPGVVAEKIATIDLTLGAKVITTRGAIHFVFVALHDTVPNQFLRHCFIAPSLQYGHSGSIIPPAKTLESSSTCPSCVRFVHYRRSSDFTEER